jgi:polyhydroxyalkanoate synthesis regulator phasin
MDEAVASGKVSESDAQKFIEELTKQYEINQSNLDDLRKTLENIEKLEAE